MFSWLNVAASRIQALFSRRRLDDDFDLEVEAHLAHVAEENIRRGMRADEAYREARRHFGSVTQVKETQRENRGVPQVDTIFRDLRYAARMLRHSPGFTLIAILTLGLGIGVNTTLFTAFNAVALKPLPVKNPENIVRIERWFESGSQGNGQYFFSYPEYLDYRDHNRVYSSLIAASMLFSTLSDLPVGKLTGQLVSENYFSDLGVDAMLGRTFLPEENRTPGTHPVVVLSYQFWRIQCNRDPQILGKAIRLNDTKFTVVGVTDERFIGTGNPPQVPDFWAPLMMQAQAVPGQDWLNDPNSRWFQFFGRLNPGAGINQTQAETSVLIHQFEQIHPPADKTIAVTVERATFFGETNSLHFRVFVVLLMVVVGLVLLIACANLTNMLLARAANRHKEIAVRLALGAGRSRLIRQLLTESLLLSLLGGVVGLLFSTWASRLLWVAIQQILQSFLWTKVELVVRMTPDIRVFAYTLAVSLLTGIVFGLAPALQSSKRDVSGALKDEGSPLGQRVRKSRLRSFLLAAQVGVSMLLLINAGLLVRGLLRSKSADPGFETRKVFLVSLNYGKDPAKSQALYKRVVERLETLPEIRRMTLADRVPMSGTWTPPVRVEKSGSPPLESRTLANRASGTFFDTLGIPILRGRTFTRQEGETEAKVVVVSEAAAHSFWPGEDPIGKRAKLDMNFRGQWVEFEVIGVAKTVRSANLSRLDPSYFYLPTGSTQLNGILIRMDSDSKNAVAPVRAALAALDKDILPSLSIFNLEDGFVGTQRFLAKTLAMFGVMLAALALVLAGLGIYGVMSYSVSQRTREIGIRMTLGATQAEVLKSVIVQGLRPVFLGTVLGLAGAAGVSTFLKATLVFPGTPDMFFGVSVFDPLTFIGLSCFLGTVALIASAVPARRAARVDPMVALRWE
jgi:putative ABC transport system permease protein